MRWLRYSVAWKLAVLLILSGCNGLATPTGERPLTLKEQVYQAGGLLEGVIEEIASAKAAGTLKGPALAKVTAGAEAAFKTYQVAKKAAIAGDEAVASKNRLELIQAINALRQDLAKALTGGAL